MLRYIQTKKKLIKVETTWNEIDLMTTHCFFTSIVLMKTAILLKVGTKFTVKSNKKKQWISTNKPSAQEMAAMLYERSEINDSLKNMARINLIKQEKRSK